MTRSLMHLPSLEEYARIKKINASYNQLETICCDECRYCRSSVNACIFGNQIRNLDNIETCPRFNKFM